jgi:glycosyltransferase involved in cell wall biosynthesis/ubiquinone/menaquinone biosynthesis C-methylase UbiE
MRSSPKPLRVGIVVVAYNAESTLVKTLDRIPWAFRDRISEIIICDDASSDDTFDHGQRWASQAGSPDTYVIRHTKNLGYGGNQKAAYAVALEHDLDVVVLLHGDGQYAPECLPDIVAPFEQDDCDAVFGSRMMDKGAAKRGGMPLYKRWGNRILTTFENGVLGTDLSEFHSGYRAYTTKLLRQIPFQANSDGFDFDTQIIAQIVHAGGRILEVPIPTYYGDEICYVNGMSYARDVVFDVMEYRLATKGFGTCEWVPTPDEYRFKEDDGSSHAVILGMTGDMPPSRILDLGCSSGLLSEKLRARGHFLVGVDRSEVEGVRSRTDSFFVADLERGIPPEVGSGFDVVIAGDVIEHLSHPVDALRQIYSVLRPGGQVFLSVPNFGHWYPRLRVAFGLFGYDRRGILDATHLRFFTRTSLRRLVKRAGFDILEETATGLPLGVITDSSGAKLVRAIDDSLVRLRPTLFGYQYLLRLRPHAEEMIWSDHLGGQVGVPESAALNGREVASLASAESSTRSG